MWLYKAYQPVSSSGQSVTHLQRSVLGLGQCSARRSVPWSNQTASAASVAAGAAQSPDFTTVEEREIMEVINSGGARREREGERERERERERETNQREREREWENSVSYK